MGVLKAIYCICFIAGIAFCVWAFASYIDAVINPLRQAWNLFDLILSYT